jgi:hypothetical protein
VTDLRAIALQLWGVWCQEWKRTLKVYIK